MSSHQKQQSDYIALRSKMKCFLFAILTGFFLCSILSNQKIFASEKHYGIMIGDVNGNYTYLDYNNEESNAKIELSSNSKAMIPIWSFTKECDVLSYSYNKSTKTVTLKNTYNNKTLLITKGKDTCTLYTSKNAAAVTKDMPSPMYISSTSNAVMVPASLLSYLMPQSGYHYYNEATMTEYGYDTYDTNGLFVFNPYSKITSLPKASVVTGITNTVTVTIPEGYSVSQIFELLVKKGVCKSSDLLYDACNNYDFSYYPLVAALPDNDETRCFRLEGYLFPDTYEFYRLMSGEDIIGKFLRNSEAKLTAYKEQATSLGYTLDQILTIASIIEKETGDKTQMSSISSIIYNRLNASMKLQLDCSTYYVERYIKPYISGDINRYNVYYNTYKCAALPAGPICNPSLSSIKAALNPASTDYFYFCSDENGTYYYATTYEEHLANLETIKNLSLAE